VVRAQRANGQAPFIEEVVMLVKRSVEKRRARVLKTRPQVRKTFPPEPELRALARSVMKRQLHPLIILPDDAILDGECRWRGLMLENPEFELDVIVVDRELTPCEVCELQLISAMHSTSLSAFDQALACKHWTDQNPGATAKELAAKIDRDPSMLTRLNSLWKTIPDVVKAAEEGRIGPKAWYQISLLPQTEQAGVLELHLAGAPAGQVAEFCRRKRTCATPAVKLARVKIAMPEATLVVSGKELSMAGVVEVLNETLKEARKAVDQYDVKTWVRMMADKAKAR
jgi:hypothetical protein